MNLKIDENPCRREKVLWWALDGDGGVGGLPRRTQATIWIVNLDQKNICIAPEREFVDDGV